LPFAATRVATVFIVYVASTKTEKRGKVRALAGTGLAQGAMMSWHRQLKHNFKDSSDACPIAENYDMPKSGGGFDSCPVTAFCARSVPASVPSASKRDVIRQTRRPGCLRDAAYKLQTRARINSIQQQTFKLNKAIKPL